MRAFALLLVIIGALVLGYQGFSQVVRETLLGPGAAEVRPAVEIPPLVGGITLVSGLILLAAHDDRRE